MKKLFLFILMMLFLATCSSSSDLTAPQFAGVKSAVGSSMTSIMLSWDPAVDDFTPAAELRYLIYYSTSSGGETFSHYSEISDPGATSFEVTGLDVNTDYYFVVRGRDGAGNSDSNTVEMKARGLAPVLHEPSNITTASMDLTWDLYDKADFASYSLHRGTEEGFTPNDSNLIGSWTDSNTVTFSDTGLTEATTYYYIVVLRNLDEQDVKGDEVRATAINPTGFQGIISGNVVWGRGNSPVLLTGDLKIAITGKLTIDPGVTVRSNTTDAADLGVDANKIAVIVEGVLNLSGTELENINFTSSSASPTRNDWWGFYFLPSGSNASVLNRVNVSYSGNGLQIQGISPSIENVVLDNNGSGVTGRTFSAYGGSNSNITNCIVRNSNQTGFYFEYYNGTATNLTSENNDLGFHISASDGLSITNIHSTNCTEGLRMSGDENMVVTVGNSTFENSTGNGINIVEGIGIIDHSTVSNSGGVGIYIDEDASLELRNSIVSGSASYGVRGGGNPLTSRNISLSDSNITSNGSYAVSANGADYNVNLTRLFISGNNGASGVDSFTSHPNSSSIPPQYENVDLVISPQSSAVTGAGDPD